MSIHMRLSVENVSGMEIPVLSATSVLDFEFERKYKNVGIVYLDEGMHGGELVGALSMMKLVPDSLDGIVVLEKRAPSAEITPFMIDQRDIEKRLGKRLANGRAEVLYDISGEHDGIVPRGAFTVRRDEDDRGPYRFRLIGELDNLTDSDTAKKIRRDVLGAAKLDLVRHILTDRISVRDERNLVAAKTVFDCMLLGKTGFPLDEQDVATYIGAASVPYIEVFENVSMATQAEEAVLSAVRQADEWFMNSVPLWDYALARFQCPLTFSEWRLFREDELAWDYGNMLALGELVGVGDYIDTMLSGVPVEDIMA